MTKQLGLVVCGGVGIALIIAACSGEAINDVGDVDGQSGAGASGDGGTNGIAGEPSGDAGSKPRGGTSNAGTAGSSPMTEGGTGAAAGESPLGGTGGGSACDSPGIVPLFDFDDASVVVNDSTLGTASKAHWIKSAYDSTNTATGGIDSTANPPDNPENLANLSTLSVDASGGDPGPALRFAIPFSASTTKAQIVNLVYPFASYAEPAAAVDLRQAKLKARVKLAVAPSDDCAVAASAWTTGTDPASGTTYNHVDGPRVNLVEGDWVTLEMDLNKSLPASAVNQMGFWIRATCPDLGTGGMGGTPSTDADTVVLFDNIETSCE